MHIIVKSIWLWPETPETCIRW